jgi:hypothetical protein
MVSAAQVVAEVLRLGIYSTSDLRSKKLQVVQGADKNTFE